MMRRLAFALTLVASPLAAQSRIADLVMHTGELPARLVGYGLVVGLDGTGDRSFGTASGTVHTVQSVTNLLRRFNIEVPADHLRLRNVAAVLVTAEVSPYLRPGGKFEVSVASLGDATSLRGGVLWMTPLVADPNGPALATAQGTLPGVVIDPRSRFGSATRGGSTVRIPDGGLLEVAIPATAKPASDPILALRVPDLGTASRIADVINKARGAGTARVQDPGAVLLKSAATAADSLPAFLAAIDTLKVDVPQGAHIVIDSRTGMVVAGGDVQVGKAVVSLKGITVRVGGDSLLAGDGIVRLPQNASVQDVASGLHAFGALPSEIAAVFDALRSSGALTATVVVR